MLWSCKGTANPCESLGCKPTPSLRVAPQHCPDKCQLAAEAFSASFPLIFDKTSEPISRRWMRSRRASR